MDDNNFLNNDAVSISQSLRDAGEEISQIAQHEIVPAAGLIEDAFSSAARSIERDLSRAARSGTLSLKALSQSLLRDLGRTAIDSLVRKPIQGLLTNAFSTPFGGARSNGGRVNPGSAFLVGERGPELFIPPAAGSIVSNGQAGAKGNSAMVVNITLPGVRDPEGFRQSQTQIAASLARALGRGQRNL